MARKFRGRRRGRRTARKKVAKNVRSYVKRSIEGMIENKYVLATANSLAIDSTPGAVVSPFVAITQGTDRLNRLGNRIKQIGVRMNIQFRNGNAGAVGTQQVRMIAFIDKAVNGLIFANTDIIANTATAGNNYLSPLNPNTFPSRFILIKDQIITEPQANATALQAGQIRRFYFNLKRHNLIYSANTGTVTSIVNGVFYIYFISDTATASSPPNIDYSLMGMFEDA